MTFDPATHHRRSIRLQGCDYSRAGAYFVTVCTQNHACLFGEVAGGSMQPNGAGQMVTHEWNRLETRFPGIELDAFVIMPNHIHRILVITVPVVGAGLVPAPNGPTTRMATVTGATTRVAPTLGDIVGTFKSCTTVLYAGNVRTSRWPAFLGRLWQRNYYEHIIRDYESLESIRKYIADNPMQWACHQENPLADTPLHVGAPSIKCKQSDD